MRNPHQFVQDPAIRSRVTRDGLAVDRLLHGHCRYCAAEIVFAPAIGWIEPHAVDDSDSCAASRLRQHKPVVRTVRR